MISKLFPKSKFTKNESNSQLLRKLNFRGLRCFQRANLRKMKAIHNLDVCELKRSSAVSKEQIYEKWKQFTTRFSTLQRWQLLFPKSKFTKNESNSQPKALRSNSSFCCFQRANLRKMKAIHNCLTATTPTTRLFPKSKFTKNESNSQLTNQPSEKITGCFQRANLRKMKAIHNSFLSRPQRLKLFPKSKFTKNESNSQPYLVT